MASRNFDPPNFNLACKGAATSAEGFDASSQSNLLAASIAFCNENRSHLNDGEKRKPYQFMNLARFQSRSDSFQRSIAILVWQRGQGSGSLPGLSPCFPD
jgi:hypothetical protein